jgi:hypothetical protein
VQVEALGVNETHAASLVEALQEECKTESVQVEWVKAPRLIPFAYDPSDPRRPKDLFWWRVSFDTTKARKRAAAFLSKRDAWTIHPKLFRFPYEMRAKGLVLAEHVLDDVKLFLKTTQININSWLTLAHASALAASQRAVDTARATTAQFEWLVESAAHLALYSSHASAATERPLRVEPSTRLAPSTLLDYDRARWHARTIGPD